MLACILTFVLNYQTRANSASSATFVVFILMNFVGASVCRLMVSEHRLVRPDGSKVQVPERPDVSKEFLVLSRFLDVRYWRPKEWHTFFPDASTFVGVYIHQ
jgi:hypothetical protein